MLRRRASVSAALICVRVNLAARVGVGGFSQQVQSVSCGQVLKSHQRGGEMVSQCVGAGTRWTCRTFPDQHLMGAYNDLDGLRLR